MFLENFLPRAEGVDLLKKTASLVIPFLAAFLFLLCVTTGPAPSFASGETAVVQADTLNVRSGPGTTYDIIGQTGRDARLSVLDKSGDWLKVQADSGPGWVAGWLVAIEQPRPEAPPASGQAAPGQNVQDLAVVSGSYVNVRSGPGTGYDVLTQAAQGDRLPVLDKSGDWYKVSLSTGATGWIAGWLVAIEQSRPPEPPASEQTAPPPQAKGPQGSGKTATVSGSTVNVRSGPGTDNGITGQVKQGDTLAVFGQSGDWYQVSLPGGGSGWVAGWLVSVKAAPPSAPPLSPALPSRGDTGRGDGGTDRTVDGTDSDVDGNTTGGAGDVIGKGTGKLISLKVNNTGGKTSTVVKADVPIDYNAFTMNNPDRLVVDFKGVAPGDLPAATAVNSSSISQVRTGVQKNPLTSRVVFDLRDGAQYVATLSGDRKSLTVDTYIPDLKGSYKGKTVFIDPGHGGSDPGAIGQKGLKEKDVTLDIAKRVQRLLEAQGAKVIMARTGDWDVDLYNRTKVANSKRADAFVSIHINANPDPANGGTSTYFYNNDGKDQPAARVNSSKRLAAYVQGELLKALGLRNLGTPVAHFAVLRTANMPSILAEVAFISNAREEGLLRTDDFKNKAAEAIVRGIGLYFADNNLAYNP